MSPALAAMIFYKMPSVQGAENGLEDIDLLLVRFGADASNACRLTTPQRADLYFVPRCCYKFRRSPQRHRLVSKRPPHLASSRKALPAADQPSSWLLMAAFSISPANRPCNRTMV